MGYRNYSGTLLSESSRVDVRYVKGTSASETLYGSSGNDEFEGGGGLDTFVGGAGDDFYWLRSPHQKVVEQPGGGIDTVKIWLSYALPANVENLIVFGGGSYAVGNDLNNIIKGEDGSQFIYGGRGEDVLIGGGGADTFVIVKGEGNKVIQDFQSWSDKLRLIGGNLHTFEAVKAAMTQQGSDVVLNDGGTMILFRNATISQFTARDFQLPFDRASLTNLTFSDDFNTLQTGTVWQTSYGYAGDGLGSFTLMRNGEQQIYVSPEFKGTTGSPLGLNPYSVNNGVLTITAQPVSQELSAKMWGYNYTSGMLFSKHAQTYGYFEIRADLPEGQGLWPAFWLLGPQNTEIDILELIGSAPHTPENAIHSNSMHAGGANFQPHADGYHTYGALWTPTNIVFYIDGTEVWRVATPAEAHQPMRMIVNLAVGGNWPGSPDATTPWPAQMKVDYVKAWALPDPNYKPPPPPTTSPPPTSPTTPSTGGVVLTSTKTGSTLIGGTGNDTLNASQGYDVLTGGAGADTFVFGKEPWAPIRITDFKVGEDKLDLSALFKAAGYTGSDPVADRYVSFESDGAGGTKLLFDRDGVAAGQKWPNYIITLDKVPTAGLTWAKLSGGGTASAPSGGSGPTSISITGAPSHAEGNSGTTRFDFTVLRSGDTKSPSIVDWFVWGQADASDIATRAGSIHFAAGETSKVLQISVFGDTRPEPNETFHVTLSNARGAVIGTGTAKGTILDDDGWVFG